MSDRKGFTLIEIIAVAVILGILATVAAINYTPIMTQQAAQAAQNNLVTIYQAEKSFYLQNGYYCSTSSQNTTCADNLSDLNTGLLLNIADNQFNYACSDPNSGTDGNNGSSFTCTATNIQYSNLTLTLTNNPIVLPGGTGCTASPWASPCNPSCSSTNNPSYCPSTSV